MGARQFSTASDAGSETGSDRSSSESMKLKSAVLAPMPSARDRIATRLNVLLAAIVRTP
jgi:hypothetical protein